MPAAFDPIPSGPADAGADDTRAATVAALAAAIAHVGPDGGRSNHTDPDGAEESARRTPGSAGTDRDGTGRRGPATGGGRGAADRRRPPPDDPEGPAGDAPGDPEVAAKNICLRLLTVRARSRAELTEALRRRGIPGDSSDRVLDRLAAVGLVDDAAYAEAFVASKHRDRGLARGALRQELRRKGVDSAAAEQALAAIDSSDERQRAAALVNQKLDSAMFAGLPAARRRLLGMLARRGYPASLAAAVVNDALRGYAEPLELDPTDQADDDGARW
jgi:regulatory protein